MAPTRSPTKTRSKNGVIKPRNIAYDPSSPKKKKISSTSTSSTTKANTSKPRAKKTATGRVTKKKAPASAGLTKKKTTAATTAVAKAKAKEKANKVEKAVITATKKVATAEKKPVVKKVAAAAAKKPAAVKKVAEKKMKKEEEVKAAALAPGLISKVSNALLMVTEFVMGSPPKVGILICLVLSYPSQPASLFSVSCFCFDFGFRLCHGIAQYFTPHHSNPSQLTTHPHHTNIPLPFITGQTNRSHNHQNPTTSSSKEANSQSRLGTNRHQKVD